MSILNKIKRNWKGIVTGIVIGAIVGIIVNTGSDLTDFLLSIGIMGIIGFACGLIEFYYESKK